MEIVGDDGTLVHLPLSSLKLIGRGSGIPTEDRTIAKNQASLKAEEVFTEGDDAPPPDKWWEKAPLRGGSGKGGKTHRVRVEALGPNPICVLLQGGVNYGEKGAGGKTEVRFLEQGEACWLGPGDRISLSIVKPRFYTIRGPERRELAGRSQEEVGGATEHAQGDRADRGREAKGEERGAGAAKGLGTEKGVYEEEPTDEKAARAESSKDAGRAGGKRGREDEDEMGKQGDGKRRRERKDHDNGGLASKRAVVGSAQRRPAELDVRKGQRRDTELELGGDNESDRERDAAKGTPLSMGRGRGSEVGQGKAGPSAAFDPIKEYGLLVEGKEFDQYDQRNAHNTRPWTWQIGPSKKEDDLDEEPFNEEEVEAGRGTSRGGARGGAKAAPQKSAARERGGKVRDDEDEWTGDSEEEAEEVEEVEKGLRGLGRAPAVATRSRDRSRGRRKQNAKESEGKGGTGKGKAGQAEGAKSSRVKQAADDSEEEGTSDQGKGGRGTSVRGPASIEKAAEAGAPKVKGSARAGAERQVSGSAKKAGVGKRKKGSENEEESSGEDEPTAEDLDFIVDEEEDVEEKSSDESEEEEWEDEEDPEAPKRKPKGKQVARDTRPMCRYGGKCYRKNPDHLGQFRHA